MTLSSAEMRELEAQSAVFRGVGHSTYLAEAINAVRVSGQPHSALQLLSTLQQEARKDQKDAIVEVRRWIERRLHDHPGTTADRLILELGWLRRISVARAAGVMTPQASATRLTGQPRVRKR